MADGLQLVPARPLLAPAPEAWFALAPGDRPLVEAGEVAAPGAPLVRRARGASLVDVPASAVAAEAAPGDRWDPPDGGARRRGAAGPGELLYRLGLRWRVASCEETDLVESPVAGVVREARPGVGISIATTGRALPGTLAVGGWTRGRLELATDATGELRAASLDVGFAGAVLVVGSRVDAETLIRARAMGVRGVIVAGLGTKDQRDFRASEARLRASLHRAAPFGVLVLDGHVRRPIASAVMGVLEALAGRETAILLDPPCLLFDADGVELPMPAPDEVRIRHGAAAGREGHWLGPAGLRRWDAGVHLEAGLVQLDEAEAPLVVPLADLERFV